MIPIEVQKERWKIGMSRYLHQKQADKEEREQESYNDGWKGRYRWIRRLIEHNILDEGDV